MCFDYALGTFDFSRKSILKPREGPERQLMRAPAWVQPIYWCFCGHFRRPPVCVEPICCSCCRHFWRVEPICFFCSHFGRDPWVADLSFLLLSLVAGSRLGRTDLLFSLLSLFVGSHLGISDLLFLLPFPASVSRSGVLVVVVAIALLTNVSRFGICCWLGDVLLAHNFS